MFSALKFVLLASLFAVACGLPAYNITVTVPEGFSNHGTDDLFCLPTKWWEIFIFFAVNYASHAATVKSVPGQTYFHMLRDFILALLLPYSGFLRSMETLSRCSWPNENDLTKAVRAGAFCVVVRNRNWKRSESSKQQDQERESQAATQSQAEEGRIERREGSANFQPERSSESYEMQRMADAQQSKGQLLGKPRRSGVEFIRETSARRNDRPTGNAENSPNQTLHDLSTSALESPASHPTRAETLSYVYTDMLPEGTSMLAKAHQRYRSVHGIWTLPEGYSLAHLPSNAKILGDTDGNIFDMTLCSSYNVPRAVLAIIQTIYASVTLYRTRGDQIQQFGYAAFGLTVIPYIIMSVLNLCCALLVPDYPTCYIARSLESDEAIERGARIEGLIGRVVQERSDDGLASGKLRLRADLIVAPFERVGTERWSRSQSTWASYFVMFILGAIPFAVIGGLTHFHPGRSTKAQQVWTMLWLVFDIFYGTSLRDLYEADHSIWRHWTQLLIGLAFFAFVTTPAIGGFVVVGQMLEAYGSCNMISGMNAAKLLA